MIPNQAVLTTQSNHSGRSIKASIDDAALAHVMQVLSGLYSDIHMALIREYSTNALDAHREAGIAKPIEVTLPGRFSSSLIIRDYGVGLSVDDLINIYSRYGASTKRGSDDFNGMLGVGAKAAWAYTHSFSMVAVKNGVKTTAALNKGDDGVGRIDIMDTSATDEPNGVQIIIPVTGQIEIDKFNKAAEQFFRFWNKNDVLVNGKAPFTLSDHALIIDLGNGVFIVDRNSAMQSMDTIVMGGVAYPLDGNHSLGNYGWQNRVVLFADMGAVSFTPSRESLNYTADTNAFIKLKAAEVQQKLVNHLSKNIESAKSFHEAATLAKAYDRYGVALTYKGHSIPSYINYHKVSPSGTRHDRSEHIVHVDSNTVWIKHFNGQRVSSNQRAKIATYIGEPKVVRVLVNDAHAMWLDHATVHDWADVVKTKVAGEKRGFTWGVLTQFGNVEEVEELGEKIVWVDSTDKPEKTRREAFYNQYPDYQIVIRRVKYEKQLDKEKPGALSLRQFAQQERERIQKEIDTFRGYDYYDARNLEQLKSMGKIHDPQLAHHVATFDSNSNGQRKQVQGEYFVKKWFGWGALKDNQQFEPFRRYPLVESNHMDHSLIYINAIYDTYYAKDAK